MKCLILPLLIGLPLLAGCASATPAAMISTPVPDPTEAPASTSTPAPIAESTAAPTTRPTQTPVPTPTFPPHWSLSVVNIPSPRGETGAAVIDGKIYVPGGMTVFSPTTGFDGTDVLAIYDPATDTWSTGANVPHTALNHAAVAAHGGKLYTFGGHALVDRDHLREVLIYDVATDTWSEGPEMPAQRQGSAAVTLGDYIYVIGGDEKNNHLLRFDPASGEWAELAPLLEIRNHVQAVVLDGKIWVLGGRWYGASNSIVDFHTVEIYDPAADTWTAGPRMNRPHAGAAAAVIDGKIYIAGGELLSEFPPGMEPSVEVYDPAVGQWEVMGSMPIPLHGVSGASVDGKFYILAGSTRAGTAAAYRRVLIYTP